MAEKKLVEIDFGDGKTRLSEEAEFDVIQEGWNIYKLEDGTSVKCRFVATKIFRAVDESGNYGKLDDGSPMVSVTATIMVSAKE